jgi:transposase-like protein
MFNLTDKFTCWECKPNYGAAFKVIYLACYEMQEKWQRTRVRDWAEIYPQLCIYFDDVMAKYIK